MCKTILNVRTFFLGCLISFFGFIQFSQAQNSNEILTISLSSASNLNLSFQGLSNKDYSLQTNGNLTRLSGWTNSLYFATYAQGGFSLTNPLPGLAPLFYRTVRLPQLLATTTNVVGNENTNLLITLTGTDPLYSNSVLQAVISQLPTNGLLLQVNGTAIATVPTIVTSSSNQVWFAAPTNTVATNYDSFSYYVRRVTNGVTSASQPVTVSVVFTPLPPIATLQFLTATENHALLFALTATDPTPAPGAGPLKFYLETLPVGLLYQVNSDNLTAGAQLTVPDTRVTNANNLLIYLPPADEYGATLDSLNYYVVNRSNQFSAAVNVPITILETNYPPVVESAVLNAANTDGADINFIINYVQINGLSVNYYFTVLPTNGTLYQNGALVSLGQPYSPSQSFDYIKTTDPANCLSAYSYGSNYDQWAFYAVNSSNLTSAIGSNVLNISNNGMPPTPVAPTNVICTVNPGAQTINSPAGTNFTLTAVDTDSPYNPYNTIFQILSVPQYGHLYFLTYDLNTAKSFPLKLLESGTTNFVLKYVPNAGFNNAQGLDSFTYQLSQSNLANPCTFPVTFSVEGPVLSPQPNISGEIITNNDLIAYPSVTGFAIYGDASVDTNSGLITCAIAPSLTNTSFQAATGSVVLANMPAHPGVSVSYTNGFTQLIGTAAHLSQVFTNGSVTFHNSQTAPNANFLSISLTQESGNPLTTQYYLPVVYTNQ